MIALGICLESMTYAIGSHPAPCATGLPRSSLPASPVQNQQHRPQQDIKPEETVRQIHPREIVVLDQHAARLAQAVPDAGAEEHPSDPHCHLPHDVPYSFPRRPQAPRQAAANRTRAPSPRSAASDAVSSMCRSSRHSRSVAARMLSSRLVDHQRPPAPAIRRPSCGEIRRRRTAT